MSKVKCFSAALAVITIAAGVLFGILPKNWIELFFHADPDGGSGLLELFFALALIAMGAGMVLYAARRRSRAKSNAARTARRFFPVQR
jgi:O-antigen/teichoic acid export membrane protein